MPITVATPLPSGTGLDLCAIWLNLADDLADVMAFEYAGEAININTTLRAEVRQLVGRRRLVRRSQRRYDQFSMTFDGCTAEQVQWLRDRVGELMCIRDHVGSKVYGVYTELPREVETMTRDWADVKLTFDEIDHSEAV